MGSGSSLAVDVSMNTVLTEEERLKYQDSGVIRKVLSASKTIAIVGLSPKSERPSYFVGSYLKSEGYRIIPVNPTATEILGEKSYPDLLSIPNQWTWWTCSASQRIVSRLPSRRSKLARKRCGCNCG